MSVHDQARAADSNGSGGIRERVVDARVALLLAGEGRSRVTARLFGVPRRDSAILALIGLAALGDMLARKTRRLRRRPRRPTLMEAFIGAAGVKGAAHRLVGPASREVADFGTLVSIVVAVAMLRPVLGPPIRSAKAASRRVRAVISGLFEGLFGHARVRAVVAAAPAANPLRRRST